MADNSHISGGMDCVTALYARVTGSSPNEKEQKFVILSVHLGSVMDCVIALYAGVVGSSPTEKEKKFVLFSFIHNPCSYLYWWRPMLGGIIAIL